jgi:hypothetical protein
MASMIVDAERLSAGDASRAAKTTAAACAAPLHQ